MAYCNCRRNKTFLRRKKARTAYFAALDKAIQDLKVPNAGKLPKQIREQLRRYKHHLDIS